MEYFDFDHPNQIAAATSRMKSLAKKSENLLQEDNLDERSLDDSVKTCKIAQDVKYIRVMIRSNWKCSHFAADKTIAEWKQFSRLCTSVARDNLTFSRCLFVEFDKTLLGWKKEVHHACTDRRNVDTSEGKAAPDVPVLC
eukprot:scaffold31634_cov80-Skeletonema_dohrnii-CCMP3373.AAC.1